MLMGHFQVENMGRKQNMNNKAKLYIQNRLDDFTFSEMAKSELCVSDIIYNELLKGVSCAALFNLYEDELFDISLIDDCVEKTINYYILEMAKIKGKNVYLGRKITAQDAVDIYEKFKNTICYNEVKGAKLNIIKLILINSKYYYGNTCGTWLEDESAQRGIHKKELRKFILGCRHLKDCKRRFRKNSEHQNIYEKEPTLLFEDELLPYLILFILYYHGYYQNVCCEFHDEIANHIHRNRKLKKNEDCKMIDTVRWVVQCMAELHLLNSKICEKISIKITCGTLYAFLNTANFYKTDIVKTLKEKLLNKLENFENIPNKFILANIGTWLVCKEVVLNGEKATPHSYKIIDGYKDWYYRGSAKERVRDLSEDYRPLFRSLSQYFNSERQNEWSEFLNGPFKKELPNDTSIAIFLRNQLYAVLFLELELDYESYASIMGYDWVQKMLDILLFTEVFPIEVNPTFLDNTTDGGSILDVVIYLLCDIVKYLFRNVYSLSDTIEKIFENIIIDATFTLSGELLNGLKASEDELWVDEQNKLINVKRNFQEALVSTTLAIYLLEQ